MRRFLCVYSRTCIIGVFMTAYSTATILWGTSTLAACIVAATVIVAQSGSDSWRERAHEAVRVD